jgi:transcriptional regulator with XRE-family HTH domain
MVRARIDEKRLGRLVGVHFTTVYRWRSGQQRPNNIDTLARLADALGVDLLELYRSLPRGAGAQFREDAPSEDAA